MSPKFRPPLWIWAVLAVSTAVSIAVAVQRYRQESSNRAVHLIVDMPDVRALAVATGNSPVEVLEKLKASGVTAVAVAEETFDDMVLSGRLVAQPGSPPRYLISDPDVASRIATVAENRMPVSKNNSGAVLLTPNSKPIRLPGRISDLKTYGLGLDRLACRQVKEAGLVPIARVSNPPAAGKNAIKDVVRDIKTCGAKGVIFSGDQVLGRRDLVPYAASLLNEAHIWFGAVEFTNQGGFSRMLKESLQNTVRVHSMLGAEIDRAELPDIVDRYVRAVVERNVRAVFLRPANLSAENPLNEFAKLISAVRSGLANEGYAARPARPFSEPWRPEWAAFIAAFGIAVISAWFLARFIGGIASFAAFIVFLALAAGVWFGFGEKYAALLAAIVFPSWAVLAALNSDNDGGGTLKWTGAYFWVTGISIIGGLHVAALLTQLPYMIRLDQFSGVKLSLFLPPLIVLAYLALQGTSLRQLAAVPVKWGEMLIGVLILAALAIMLMRAGNDSPADVSALELKIRNLLDRFLPERPRTKEFLIGHPAFVLALGTLYRGERRLLPVLGLLIAIGQASVLNTFSHSHTPIAVSLMRVITGMAVGGIIGLATLWIYAALTFRKNVDKPEAASTL